MEDLALVKAFQQGKTSAFNALYDRYADNVYRFVRAKTSENEEAKDITQNVFLEVIRTLSKAKITRTFKAWLFGIAANEVRDFWIKHYQMPIDSIDLLLENGHEGLLPQKPATPKSTKAQAELLQKLYEQIPPTQARVIHMRFYQGLTRKEIAAELQVPEETVKTWQYRALKVLRSLDIRDFSSLGGAGHE